MEKKNEILNELQSISPLIAAIEKVNVFTVPEGYFNSISDTVMLSLGENFSPSPTLLNKKDVPDGYFENLSASILDKIRKQEAGELPEIFSTIKKESPLRIPGNYFETLPGVILNKIKTVPEDSENLPEVLAYLKKVQPFTIPVNYFSELPDNILNKIKQQSGPAKVVSMQGRFSVMKYAAAAVITGMLALGIYKYSNQPEVTTVTAVAMDPSIEKGKMMDDKKFTETLNNLSPDEIVNYLQRHSSEADIAVLRSNLEEKSLPNEEDYILDDKTLDNFLKEIESTTN